VSYRIVLCIGSYCAGFAICIYCIVSLAVRIVSYRTILYSPRKYSTNRGSYVLCRVCRTCMYCRPIAHGSCRTVVAYCIVLPAVRIVSYCVVSYCASGHTILTLSSDRVVLSRIVSRFHSRSLCSDRILIFPGLHHDCPQAVLYEIYGTICGRHDTILGRDRFIFGS
jgi:hypothetical protein